MSFEFDFYVRDGLIDHIPVEDINKLELNCDGLHPKEVLIDIIAYCSLGDIEKAKLYVDETISFLNSGQRAGLVQRLLWHYWRRCFIKTKLAVDKKPETIETCKDFHIVIRSYKDFMSNFNGFDWTWYQHFVIEARNWARESDLLNNEYQN